MFYKDLEMLKRRTKGSPSIKIAVLDGNVDVLHPCFKGAALSTIETVASSNGTINSDHGTHITSIIFGRHHADVGIAPNCTGLLIPIFAERAENQNVSCSQLELARAIHLAISHGANIINISAGQLTETGESENILKEAIQQCEDQNILVIAAVGNDGCDCLHVPAANSQTLAIGALDEQGNPQAFSNWGEDYQKNGLLLPGVGVLGATSGNGFVKKTGTSFATARATGIAALLMSLELETGKSIDQIDIKKLLLSTAEKCFYPSHCEKHLAGKLNLKKAIKRILPNQSIDPSQYISTHEREGLMPSENKNAIINNQKNYAMNDLINPIENELPETNNETVEMNENIQTEESTLSPSEHEVEPSCGCGGNNEPKKANPEPAKKKTAVVYALGTVGIDFVKATRKKAFLQKVNGNIEDPKVMVDYLKKNPFEAQDLLWTLNQDGTPIYAVFPQGAFADNAYKLLLEFIEEQESGSIERVAIPGIMTGKVNLSTGQEVPVLIPNLRGISSWSTPALVEAIAGKSPKAAADKVKHDAFTARIYNFLERVYHELQNLGITPHNRAVNYAATNAFQAGSVFHQAINEGMELADIAVTKSPLLKPGADLYNVKLTFFDPKNRFEKAKKLYQFTVDVNDIVPVTVGNIKSWSVY